MQASDIKRVLVLGAGVSGQQIALQFARFGHEVTVHDASAEALAHSRVRHPQLLKITVARGFVDASEVAPTLSRLAYESDPARAAATADLLVESVPEDRDLKRQVLARFHSLCPARTIFTTNTSYMLPSSFATASGRPERFAAFHFHTPVWEANAVDVMCHSRTLPWVADTLCDLAVKIGQIPIRIKRETPGYLFNSMLGPFLMQGMDLAARGVADFREIDRAWMAVSKMKSGPFGIIDLIGLDTVYGIVKQYGKLTNPQQAEKISALLRGYIDQGHLGEKAGQGFYSHPFPEYMAPEFLGGHGPTIPSTSPPPETPVAGESVDHLSESREAPGVSTHE